MSFKWIAIAVVALMAMPGGARANGTEGDGIGIAKPNPTGLCKKAVGGEYRQCVVKHRAVMRRILEQAISECKAEREATQAELPQGERNGEGRSAFRECVKAKVRAALAELKAKFDTAVEQCKTEHESDPIAFRETYGQGERNRRPFVRCVLQHVREQTSTL